MEWLDTELWGNPIAKWLTALGVGIGITAALRILRSFISRRLKPLTEKTSTELDDIVVATLGDTRPFFYLAAGTYAGSRIVRLDPDLRHGIGVVCLLLALLQGALWGQNLVRRVVNQWSRQAGQDPERTTVAAALGFVLRVGLWSVVIMVALANLGIEISGLVAGLGIGGVAAALAVQNVLGDLFASLSIYFDRPFDLGDFIIVDEFMGNVDRIGMRSTRITSLGGEQIIFANSDLAGSRIRNYRRMRERRIVFSVGALYATPHEKVKKIPELLRASIEAIEGVRFDRAHFRNFGADALEFEAVYHVLSPDYTVFMDRHQGVLLEVHRHFEHEGIEFAFPTRTVHLEGALEVNPLTPSPASSTAA